MEYWEMIQLEQAYLKSSNIPDQHLNPKYKID